MLSQDRLKNSGINNCEQFVNFKKAGFRQLSEPALCVTIEEDSAIFKQMTVNGVIFQAFG